jgi:phospholipid N-methyltransferase
MTKFASDDLDAFFSESNILEIGGNGGDITCQLLALGPTKLTVTEIDEQWCHILHQRFKGSIVKVVNNDILDAKSSIAFSRYNVIVLKELLNALPLDAYETLFENCLTLLEKKGKLVIVDYSPLVIYRHFLMSFLRQPWGVIENIQRLHANIKLKKTLSKSQLGEFFPANKFVVRYCYGLDYLNGADSRGHKFLERILPCKYVAVIERLE